MSPPSPLRLLAGAALALAARARDRYAPDEPFGLQLLQDPAGRGLADVRARGQVARADPGVAHAELGRVDGDLGLPSGRDLDAMARAVSGDR